MLNHQGLDAAAPYAGQSELLKRSDDDPLLTLLAAATGC